MENEQPPVVKTEIEPQPSGVPLDKQKLLLWGFLAIIAALAIYGSYTSTGMTSRSKMVQSYQPPITTASKEDLDQSRESMKDSTEKMKKAQADALKAEEALRQSKAPSYAASPNGVYYPEPYQQQVQQPIDQLKQKRLEREEEGRYASSLVFSNAPQQPAVPVQMAAATVPVPSQNQAVPTTTQATEKAEEKTHLIFEYTLIEGVLMNQLIGGFSGPVLAMTTADVYSHDLQTLLIMKGTKLLGTATKVSNRDQQRLAIEFHRMIMPDGYSVDLDKVLGLDQGGETALKDKINHHYLSTFATSAMLGLLAGFSMHGTGGYYSGDGGDIYRQGASDQLSRDATRILDRQLNRLPDIEIRPGHRIKILTNRDIALPAYSDHRPVPGL